MSYNATENSASRRIATLLDEGSFVEIATCRKKRLHQTASLPDME